MTVAATTDRTDSLPPTDAHTALLERHFARLTHAAYDDTLSALTEDGAGLVYAPGSSDGPLVLRRAGSDTAHLVSAASVLRDILAARHPEHSWIVQIEGGKRDDPGRDAAAPDGQPDVRTDGDDPHTINQQGARPAPTTATHNDRANEAA